MTREATTARRKPKVETPRRQAEACTWSEKARVRPSQAGAAANKAAKPVSFMRDVAPILVENCIACHNPRKSESKYVMTTFAQLAKGGQQGEGITLEPGKPDESHFVELIRPDGQPRMPFKQDPLPKEKIATIERWVAEGAKYDGDSPDRGLDDPVAQDAAGHDSRGLSRDHAHHGACSSAGTASAIAASGYHEITFWKTADGAAGPPADRPGRAGLRHRLQPRRQVAGHRQRRSRRLWRRQALDRRAGRRGQAGARPRRDPGRRLRGCVQPRQQENRHRGRRPDHPHLRGRDRQAPAQIEDHADWIFAVAFSPDGKRLASASRDKTGKVFDLEKKESLVTFPGHAQPVYTVSFTPDGKGVATGGEDNRIRIWNPDNDGKQIREIGGFGGTVFKLRYSPDGKNLLAAAGDKIVHVFDAEGLAAAQAAGTQRLDLLPGDLARRQDRRVGKLGRRGPALEPRRRQAAPKRSSPRRATNRPVPKRQRSEVRRLTARSADCFR